MADLPVTPSFEDMGVSPSSPQSLADLGISNDPAPQLMAPVVNGATQLPWQVRGYNELFFANDPKGSANYLASKGFAPLDPNNPPTLAGGGFTEVGQRLVDAANSVPRMVGMGAGALGGGAVGNLPGALAGAGAGDAVTSAALSSIGAHYAGTESSPGSAALHGAVEGPIAEAGGRVLSAGYNAVAPYTVKPVFSKISQMVSDKVQNSEGLALLKGLFGSTGAVTNEALGADVAEGATSSFVGPNVPGVETPIDKIITNPEIVGMMKSAQAVPGNSLAQLGKDVAQTRMRVGQALGGLEDSAGNVVKGTGIVDQIDSLPNSAIPISQIDDFAKKAVSETVDQLGVASQGTDYVKQSEGIKNYLNGQLEQFKRQFTGKALEARQAAADQLAAITEGMKGSDGSFTPGLKQLEPALQKFQDRIDAGEVLKPKEKALYSNLVSQVSSAQADYQAQVVALHQADQAIENTTIPFKDLWGFRKALGAVSNFSRLELDPTNSQGAATLYGKFSDFLKAHALAVDPEKGQQFADIGDRFNVISDFQALINPAVGAATKKSATTGLMPQGVGEAVATGLKNSGSALRAVGFPGTGAAIGGAIGGYPGAAIGGLAGAAVNRLTGGAEGAAVDSMAHLNLNRQFSQAVRKLADVGNPLQEFRSNTFANWAQEAASAKLSVPATYIVAGPLSRSLGGFLGAKDAHAQEPDLSSLKNGMTLSTLVDNGFAPPNAKQVGFDPAQLPPEIQQQVNASVMQALQPLNDAIKFGSEEEIGSAYSQVAKQYPELFPAPKTGLKGEVIGTDGKVKLYDPMDRARYATKLQVDSSLGWGEKAKIVSELNSTFTVLNPKKLN